MARTQVGNARPQLKHLEFVRSFALFIISLLTQLYEYIKLHSGPLRRPLSIAKDIFVFIFGPLYTLLKDVPDDILVWLDKLLDAILNNKTIPAWVKQFISMALDITGQSFHLAQTFVHKWQVSGFKVASVYAGAEINRILLAQFMKLWLSAIKVPSFRKLAGKFLPSVTGLLDKYNQGILSLTKKGFSTIGNLPIIPLDKVGDMLKPGEVLNVMGNLSKVMGGGSSGLAGAAASAAHKTMDDAAKVADAAATAAQKTIGDAAKVADAAASAGKKVVGDLLDGGTKIAAGALNPVGTVTDAASKATKAAADKAASVAKNAVGDVLDGGMKIASGALNPVGTATDAVNNATKVADKAASVAKNAVGDVFDGGMKIASGALNPVDTMSSAVDDATRVADTAASAAKNIAGSIIGTGSAGIGSLPLVGGVIKTATGAASNGKKPEVVVSDAPEVAGNVASKTATGAASNGKKPEVVVSDAAEVAGSVASNAKEAANSVASAPFSLFGGIVKTVVTVASDGEKLANAVVDKSTEALEPIPLVGGAARFANDTNSVVHSKVTNVMDTFRFP